MTYDNNYDENLKSVGKFLNNLILDIRKYQTKPYIGKNILKSLRF